MHLVYYFLGAMSASMFLGVSLYSSTEESQVLPEQNYEPFHYPMPDETTGYEYSYSSYYEPLNDKQTGSVSFQAGAGKMEVETTVENTDFISQSKAQRQLAQKKKSSKRTSGAQDEEEDYSPAASVSVKWSSKEK